MKPAESQVKVVCILAQNAYFAIMNYQPYISLNPEVRFGRPCITGTRISVYDVLSWLAEGMTQEEILEDFPELQSIHIQACLAYAADRERRLKIAS